MSKHWHDIQLRLNHVPPQMRKQLADTAIINFNVLPRSFLIRRRQRKHGIAEYLYFRRRAAKDGVGERYIGKVADVLSYLRADFQPSQLKLSKTM